MDFKKISANFVIACCAALTLNCHAQTAPDIQKIQSRGKLVVAVRKHDAPPFFFHNKEGQLEGYDIDLAKEIAKELGVKVEFESNSETSDALPRELSSDTADLVISNFTATTQRGLQVAMTTPYLKINKVLLVNRALDLKLKSNANFAKDHPLKFGALKSTSYESTLREKTQLISKYAKSENIVTYDTNENAMKDVASGKIYAFFTDEIKADFWNKTSKSASIYSKKIVIPGQIDPISIAVNLKNTTLLNWLNLMIENMDYNGTQLDFTTKYLK